MPNSKMLCYPSRVFVLIMPGRGAGPAAGPALGTEVRQQHQPSQTHTSLSCHCHVYAGSQSSCCPHV